jgi:hypothetical protein
VDEEDDLPFELKRSTGPGRKVSAASRPGQHRSHYNEHRPHRALQLLPPNGRDPTLLNATAELRRRDLLGGLNHEYDAA